jgi:flagellar hook-basal body complex protein FliE
MGYYFEMKQEKNADKTIDEIKDIVFKNLAKDPIYYTKNGQFGVEVGYTEDNVSLGIPEEPKGEYKSSGYGKLKENKEPVNEIAIAGGLVTGGGFTSANYMDFFGLNEETVEEVDFKKLDDKVQDDPDFLKKVTNAQMAAKDGKSDDLIDIMTNLEEDEAPLEAMASIDDIVTKAEEMARGMEERGDKVSIDMIVDKALSELRTDIKNALEASLNLDTSDR